ncbi:MAG: hypothetical protein ACJAY7_000651 [Pseudohongiellaceae bacterium]|jgi:hypothetical protein
MMVCLSFLKPGGDSAVRVLGYAIYTGTVKLNHASLGKKLKISLVKSTKNMELV